ncbi:MAG TPA: hypothetical protein VEJ87_00985 [Acidimicrobiales bacterium]|nr:hypothetical protein [Acidimicrobiales bacterium]
MNNSSGQKRSSRTARMLVLPIALVAAGLLAAACSSSSSTTSAPPAKPASTGSSSSSATASSKALIHTDKAGNVGLVLTNASGLTLYRLTTDHGSSTCNGGCASTWPPLTVPSGTKITAVSGVGGTFGTITRSDGTLQVTYNGAPLYTFVGDTKPGEANGQGISGIWFAVTPAGSTTGSTAASTTGSASGSNTGAAASSTTTTTSSSYGGY